MPLSSTQAIVALLLPKLLSIMLGHVIFFKEFSFRNVLVCLFYNIFIFDLPRGQRLHLFVHSLLYASTENPAWSAVTFSIC